MYNLKAILDKQPVAIAGALRSVLFVLILAGVLVMDEKLLSAIALGAEIVLGLFVYNASTPTSSAQENEASAFAAGAEAGVKALKEEFMGPDTHDAHVAAADIPSVAAQDGPPAPEGLG